VPSAAGSLICERLWRSQHGEKGCKPHQAALRISMTHSASRRHWLLRQRRAGSNRPPLVADDWRAANLSRRCFSHASPSRSCSCRVEVPICEQRGDLAMRAALLMVMSSIFGGWQRGGPGGRGKGGAPVGCIVTGVRCRRMEMGDLRQQQQQQLFSTDGEI